MGPVYVDPLFAREAVVKEKLLVAATVFVDESCHFHIEAAVLGDFDDSCFAPPANRI